jgi:signal peptidase I
MTSAISSPPDTSELDVGGDASRPAWPRKEKRASDQPLYLTMVQKALRLLTFVVIPTLLAGLTLRDLVPPPGGEGWQNVVGKIGNQYPVPFAFALFLLFAGLIRYWHVHIPRGAYWTNVPVAWAARIERREVPAYVAALELVDALARDRVGRELSVRLSREQASAFEARRADLLSALERFDVARLRSADRALRALAEPALAAYRRRETALLFGGLALASAAALALRLRVVEAYQVLGGSMLPALSSGDRIVVSKLAYRRGVAPSRAELNPLPRRGDLVVFQNTLGEGPEHIVKRVIALPGDTVKMNGDHPLINGWVVPNCDAGLYVYPVVDGAIRGRLRIEFLGDHAYGVILGPGVAMPSPYVVKPGELFVLGDNRTNSTDSRTWGKGVPFEAIEGRGESFLLATRRNGSVDFTGFRTPLDRRMAVEGIDAQAVEEGIARCLSDWPTNTRPPEPDAPPAAAQATPLEGAAP